ncbi:hypothetical protein VPH35_065037 [Triticum aestivum]
MTLVRSGIIPLRTDLGPWPESCPLVHLVLAGGARTEGRKIADATVTNMGKDRERLLARQWISLCTYVQFCMIHRNLIRQEKDPEKPAGSGGKLYSGRGYFPVIFERRCIIN